MRPILIVLATTGILFAQPASPLLSSWAAVGQKLPAVADGGGDNPAVAAQVESVFEDLADKGCRVVVTGIVHGPIRDVEDEDDKDAVGRFVEVTLVPSERALIKHRNGTSWRVCLVVLVRATDTDLLKIDENDVVSVRGIITGSKYGGCAVYHRSYKPEQSNGSRYRQTPEPQNKELDRHKAALSLALNVRDGDIKLIKSSK